MELIRELLAGMLDALLSLPRHLQGTRNRAQRCEEFMELEHASAPQPATWESPPPQLNRLILSCGDASGQDHALRVLRHLKARHPELKVCGFGGQDLAREGMDVWEPLADLNVMGFRDVIAQLPLFLKCVLRFAREVSRADAVLLVDYPGLNQRLLRIAKRAGVPTIQHIAPQLWAWAPWRVRDFKQADRLLTILPFENAWYERRGARPTYVGHPLGDGLQAAMADEPPLEGALLDSDSNTRWVAILPGSRRREIIRNLPCMLEAATALQNLHPACRFALPHLRDEFWPLIEQALADHPSLDVTLCKGQFHRVLERVEAAWVTSGTASLEVAAHQVPHVIVYNMPNARAERLARRIVAVPWAGSLNLIAGRTLAPEHIGHGISPEALSADLAGLLTEQGREGFLDNLKPLLPLFATPGAAERVGTALESIVAERA